MQLCQWVCLWAVSASPPLLPFFQVFVMISTTLHANGYGWSFFFVMKPLVADILFIRYRSRESRLMIVQKNKRWLRFLRRCNARIACSHRERLVNAVSNTQTGLFITTNTIILPLSVLVRWNASYDDTRTTTEQHRYSTIYFTYVESSINQSQK